MVKKGTLLGCDHLLCNPYLPDAVLKHLYIPMDQSDVGNHRSLKVQLQALTPFNDPAFQTDGIEIIYRLLKVFTLCNRITFNWVTGENWRKIFEGQLAMINAKKQSFLTRLDSLKFDFQGGVVKETAKDDAEEDAEVDYSETFAEAEEERDWNAFKFGPLAICEMDETSATFDGEAFEGIMTMMKKDGVRRLKQILKIQLLDKHYFNAAVELSAIALLELHQKIFNEDMSVMSADANISSNTFLSIKIESTQVRPSDLHILLPSILNQKKVLRKVMLAEYTKEYKAMVLNDLSDADKDTVIRTFRCNLVEFYYNNMLQVVAQELERSEFTKFMSDFKNVVEKTSYGSLIFSISPLVSYSDYVSSTHRL